jgi:hypothetical protein
MYYTPLEAFFDEDSISDIASRLSLTAPEKSSKNADLDRKSIQN